MRKTLSISYLRVCQFLFIFLNHRLRAAPGLGQWSLLQKSIGIVSMHMQLMSNDRVVIYDRTDFGKSNLSLPNGKCRNDTQELKIQYDCTAHSAEYNIKANSIRPLMVQTNVWCSSGALTSDGRLIQTGGSNDGALVIRILKQCSKSKCDWEEILTGLAAQRWYASNQLLPDGRIIIIGGRGQFNYEYYPKASPADKVFDLPFLSDTNDPGAENNLYPFVHLNVDGNLFIFANNRAILFNYVENIIVRTYPEIPDCHPRSYPSTGSSVLLPLKSSNEAEVLICGGAPRGSFQLTILENYIGALNTCARIKITDSAPMWFMETMPLARVMGDMIVLPNGHVLIINGASAGTAGWEIGRNPVLSPVLYSPDNTLGSRLQILNPSTIPRMYHSTALLLRDGRVLVGGSNPHENYDFTGVLYPTELSLESFSPPYLDPTLSNIRPRILSPGPQVNLIYGQSFRIQFRVDTALIIGESVVVTMVAPSFVTHSYSMNQRLIIIGHEEAVLVSSSLYEVKVTMPVSGSIAPSGYYMLFVVNHDVPSEGIWVHIQ